MMAPVRKTFVLVHGAWHGGWCWRRVADLLGGQGPQGVHADADRARRAQPSAARRHQRQHPRHRRGQPAEMGAAVRTWCCAAIPTAAWWCRASPSRSADTIGSIVFLDAFVPENGDSMADAHLAGGARQSARSRAERGDLGVPARSAAAFLVNEKDQAWVDALCVPQPIGTMTEKLALTGARERIAQEGLHPRRRAIPTRASTRPMRG